MNNINKFLLCSILIGLSVCGVGTFFPFHSKVHFTDWKLYKYLLLIVSVNFLFVLFKKHLKIYSITSLTLAVFMFLLDDRHLRGYISKFNFFPLYIIAFVIVFIVLILIKANWNTIFLVNCALVFTYVNWIGLLSYRDIWSSYLPSFSEMILYNIKYMFELRCIGYFISNIGIIFVIISGILLLIFNKYHICYTNKQFN